MSKRWWSLTLVFALGCLPEPPPRSADREETPPPTRWESDDEEQGTPVVVEDGAPPLEFARILPQDPTVNDNLRVEIRWKEPPDRMTRVRYTWVVNGKEVIGVTRDSLAGGGHYFQRGDDVYVDVVATNHAGLSTKLGTSTKKIVNTSPNIVSRPNASRGLDGLVLSAEDADGDQVQWSVEHAPAGVSISQAGRIRIRIQNLAEDFDDTVLFVASDGHGGRSELRVPLKVNAAQAAHTEVKQVQSVRRLEQMSEDDYVRAVEADQRRLETMSDAEYDAYIKEREARSQK